MWRLLLVILLIAAAVGINYVVVKSLGWWGYFQTTYNHAPGICRKLRGIENGSADIHLLSNGLAFISSGLRVRNSEIYNNREGKIYLLDTTRAGSQPQELRISAASDFRLISPHGISTWTDPASGSVYLYVISHDSKDVVDKFLFDELSKKLTHQQRIENEYDFVSLNNLAVVSNNRFYFTNMWKYCLVMEMLFRLPWGSVGFYDGNHAQLVETDIFAPNGIAVSNNGRFLYVALSGNEEVRVYAIHDDNKITLNNYMMYTNQTWSWTGYRPSMGWVPSPSSIRVSTHVNNLFVHPNTGDIWFGASPVRYKLFEYFKSPAESVASSQVMRLTMSSEWKADKVQEVYANNGTAVTASSVAVLNMNENMLLIGTFASNAYYCELESA